MSDFHPRTRFLLALPQVGLSREELGALDVDPIIPTPERKGFGLIGPTGNGKSWALARVVAQILDAHVRLRSDPNTATLPSEPAWIVWCNWPEQAEILKRQVIGGSHLVSAWVARCKDVRNLFLDDLGGERLKGADDYSLGVLSEILDARYRSSRPVYWTSNLSPEDLPARYGSRLASRLLSAWPPFRVDGPDLRLGGAVPPPVRPSQPHDPRSLASGGDA